MTNENETYVISICYANTPHQNNPKNEDPICKVIVLYFRTQLERTIKQRTFNVIKNMFFSNLEKFCCHMIQSISQWQTWKQRNYNFYA